MAIIGNGDYEDDWDTSDCKSVTIADHEYYRMQKAIKDYEIQIEQLQINLRLAEEYICNLQEKYR